MKNNKTIKKYESFKRLSKMTENDKNNYMKYYNDILLTGVLGFKLKKPNTQANDYGLFFDKKYLDNVGISICMMPIELMAEYRDVFTEYKCDLGIKSNAFLNFDIDDHYDKLNATSVGNIAYIILNSKNKEEVKYKGKLLAELNENI